MRLQCLLLAVVVAVCGMMPRAAGHSSLERYARESVAVFVGAGDADITVQFSFPAGLSLKERRRMDTNGDGTLSDGERKAYLDVVQARAETLLHLAFNGREAVLIPLGPPELDLGDAPGVEEHSHELRMSWFARVPKDFGAGGTITLDSGLWAELPLMLSVAVAGDGGARFETANTQGLRPPSAEGVLFRVVDARCRERGRTEDKQEGR